MELYENKLSCALTTLINTLDPNVLVLGVDMSNIEQHYDRIPKFWNKWVFSTRVDIQLAPPVHNDSSGVRRAAWLWPA
jgi:fructokinase